MPSFTVPCPSCEAKVLIKNPKLAGTKVECPKCKYRFVAEPPKEATEEESAKSAGDAKDKAPADKKGEKGKDKSAAAAGGTADKPEKEKGKKKAAAGKKNNKKVVGIALGVGAVLLLGIGFVVFGGGDDNKSGSGVGGSYPSGSGSGGYVGTEGTDGEGTDGEKKETTKKKVPRIPPSDKDPTNLLPGQSVAIYRVDVGNLSHSPLGGPLFDQSMSELFRNSMGLDPSAVDIYYHCVVGDKERAPFGVIRLKEPTKPEEILAQVSGLGRNPEKTNDYTVHAVKANPFLDAVTSAFAFDSLMSDVYDKVPVAGKNPTPLPLGLCAYDTQTVLVGEYSVLKAFLGSLKDGYPPFQTVYRKMEPPPKPKDPMDMTDPMMADPMAEPMPGAETGEGAPMPKPPPKPEPPQNKDYTTNPSYLSVSGELKNLMNALEEEPGGPPVLIVAEKFDSKLYERKNIKPAYESIVKRIDPILDRTSYIGINLTQFQVRGVRATIRIVGKTDEDARTIALQHLGPALLEAVPVLSLMLSDPPLVYTPIQFRNYADPTKSYPPFGGQYPGGIPGYGDPYSMPPGAVEGQPGGLPFGLPATPAFAGQPGAFAPIPGTYGMPPGSFGSPDMTGENPMPGMEMPGMQWDPNQPKPPDPAHIDLRLIDTTVIVRVDLKWQDEIYSHVVAPRLVGLMNQIRGKAAVFAGNHTWHSLAQAVKKYVEQNKKFPRGTMDRPADSQTRVGLPYPPITRVSFFMELLPFLGRGSVSQNINPRLAWFDDKNATATASWVPELLVSYYPQTSWRAHSPLAPESTFGGTNYVAIAGVGNDAARYNPARYPDQAKLIGISGYDWGSEASEVADGLENTIYLMQVPPEFSRAWAAGGGATVVGLDPEKPMESFKHQRPDGKWGTYAIMGDGSVRWIPADIDPKVLLAMATRAGGEKTEDLDTVAPRVDAPGAKTEVKTEAKASERPSATGGPVETAPAPREK